jgi:acid phosphatase
VRVAAGVLAGLVGAALACVLTACGAGGSSESLDLSAGSTPPRSPGSRVVVVVLENREYGNVIGSPDAPYLNGLARRYGLATRSYGVRHPSLPNYLALTSGSTHGIASDCTDCHVATRNLADQLDAAGASWKAYLQGLPRPCFEGGSAGRYAKKHNPFMYYDDIAGNPARCRRVVPYAHLTADLRSGSLPAFVWISPDLCDDAHDCPLATADRHLRRLLPPLLRQLGSHGFLVVTFDEGTTDEGCCGGEAHGGHIATVVAGHDVRPGARSSAPVDHYGVLRTIEDAFGLVHLGAAARARNGSLAPVFNTPPRGLPRR